MKDKKKLEKDEFKELVIETKKKLIKRKQSINGYLK